MSEKQWSGATEICLGPGCSPAVQIRNLLKREKGFCLAGLSERAVWPQEGMPSVRRNNDKSLS